MSIAEPLGPRKALSNNEFGADVIPFGRRKLRIWGGSGNRENTNGHRPAVRVPGRPMPMVLPDVTGLSNAMAAEVLAWHGFHVTPLRPGTKAPYLDRWPERATCDLDKVRKHWREHPDDGIAIHVGGCWLLVIDVDRPELIPDWLWPHLERAVFRATTNDLNSRRGHYFYRLKPGQLFGCGRSGLKPTNGESAGFDIKCDGGAIVLGPTYHPRANEGGHYSTGPVGLIPFVPDEIAAKLSQASSNGKYQKLTTAELDAFLKEYTNDDQPTALEPILRSFNAEPGERYPTVFPTLCWAMREAKAGRFPAQRAVDELQKHWVSATHGRDDDFDRAVRDAIARADADGTVEELRARADGFVNIEAWRAAQIGFENWVVIDAPANEDGPVTRSLANVTPDAGHLALAWVGTARQSDDP